jgi:hypothetical protein
MVSFLRQGRVRRNRQAEYRRMGTVPRGRGDMGCLDRSF